MVVNMARFWTDFQPVAMHMARPTVQLIRSEGEGLDTNMLMAAMME